MEGRALSHYRILEKIGAGGMGVVYRAHDERLDRDVALKVLSPGLLTDEAARRRFRKEALTLSRLNHPNIETVYDFDTQEGVDFLVMEHIQGETLAQKLATGPLSEKEAARLGAQIASALEGAHERGIVHRDLKPGNIMVTPKGQAKVLDFGLAMLLRPAGEASQVETVSQEYAAVGTLPYMAPEQLRGEKVDARSDIYAAGAVLFEMATRHRPFPQKTAPALIYAIQYEAPPTPSMINKRISPALDGLILKALDKDPNRRYLAARELLVDLERLAMPMPLKRSPRHPGTRRNWPVFAATGLLVVTAIPLVLNSGGIRDRLLGRPAPGPIRSLAVLPLRNLSGDPAQEYFADGMAEALTMELSQIGALKVISRTSAMQYKDEKKSLPQIAQELGVEALVEGSVLREGNQVRITVQLIKGPTEEHLWGASYQRELRGIIALQSEISRAIANEIRVKLTRQEEILLASVRPVDPEAHETYLKGRYYLNRWPAAEYTRCAGQFEEAVKRDPSYADAYSGLAACYSQMSWDYPPKEVYPRARAAAEAALKLDANQAEAYAALGAVNLFFDWDWAGANQNLRRALELSPNLSYARLTYSNYLVFQGRSEEAIREAKKALELDPVSILANRSLSFTYQLSRRYTEYAAQSQATLELAPENVVAKMDLAWAYALQGMREKALAEIDEGVPWLGRALVLATLGERERALHWLAQQKQRSTEGYADPFWYYAAVYAALGESDEALRWLEQAYEERSSSVVQLKTNPALDPLRDEPRFKALLRRMNFPE